MKSALFFSLYMVFTLSWILFLIGGNLQLATTSLSVFSMIGSMILFTWIMFFVGYLVVVWLLGKA